MKTKEIKYITNVYPLIDAKLSREDCKKWMKDFLGYPTPPRSACTFCPYHSTEEWLYKIFNKEEWAEVDQWYKAIRDKFYNLKKEITTIKCFGGHMLMKIVFKEDPQMDLFKSECEGLRWN